MVPDDLPVLSASLLVMGPNDPNDPRDICRGVVQALASRTGSIHPLMADFTYPAFENKTHEILTSVLSRSARAS